MSTAKVKLAIIGVGLIGGSLGLCLKDKLGEEIYITGLCRTQASMDKAMKLGAVDFATADVQQVVHDADIVFLSPPVLQIVPMVKKILPYLKKERFSLMQAVQSSIFGSICAGSCLKVSIILPGILWPAGKKRRRGSL